MNELTFGRYVYFDTPTHKVDARNKVFLLILLMVTIFLQFSLWSTNLIMSGIYLVFLITLMLISHINPLKIFKSLATMWFLILFLLIVYIFIPNNTYKYVAFTIGNYKVYWDAFYQCGYIILRLVMVLALTTILTTTTKPLDLTYAIEWYMTPLKVIHFPAHEIAMTLSIALRFIPTLLDETDRIMKAQASRGIDFTRGGLFKRFRAIISLIIPLFISAIEKSDELANAMEARGYDPRSKRTRYREYHFHVVDIIALVLVLALFGGVLALFIIDHNGHQVDIINLFNPNLHGF